MENSEDLLAEIQAEFADVGVPENIVSHQCSECEGVQQAFLGRQWQDVAAGTIELRHSALPLLTPGAYHSYVPAYLSRAVRDPSSTVAEFLMFSLENKHIDRRAECAFTPKQVATILRVAEYIAAKAGDFNEEIAAIRQSWTTGLERAV